MLPEQTCGPRGKTAAGRTRVRVQRLDEAGRVRELARMLGARATDKAALQHATELLAAGVAERARARKAATP